MKATGIVRRIDDLGRVVIPKEIRRTLRIREGEPLEIFTDHEGEIILKKYSPIGELALFAQQYAESLAQTCGHVVCIADRDQVIAAAGGAKGLIGRSISKQIEDAIENRDIVAARKGERRFIPILEGDMEEAFEQVVIPIICEGDAIGAVMIYTKEETEKLGEVEQKLAQAAASFLGRQMEQ